MTITRSLSAAALAVGILVLTGCGGAPTPATVGGSTVAVPTPVVLDAMPTVVNPEYTNWKQYALGTTVVRKKVSTNPKQEGKATVETTTIRLAEVTETKAFIDMQITVEKPEHPTQVNPTMRLDYLAKFRVPPGMTEQSMTLPDPKAKASGEETLKVQGKEYQCVLYTWTSALESGPMPVKLWLSDQMPGRVVKKEFTLDNAGSKAVEEVIDVRIPRGP